MAGELFAGGENHAPGGGDPAVRAVKHLEAGLHVRAGDCSGESGDSFHGSSCSELSDGQFHEEMKRFSVVIGDGFNHSQAQ